MSTKIKTIPRWSFSTWQGIETCPQKVKYRKIDGRGHSTGFAANRGTRLHKTAEDYVNGKTKELTGLLSGWEADLRDLKGRIKRSKVWETEGQWAFTKKWEPCDFEAKKAWVRMVLDVYFLSIKVGTFIDYKSGNWYDSHEDQMELYAVGMFIRFPKLIKVTGECWYFDHNNIEEREYHRRDLEVKFQLWNTRGINVTTMTKFEATPGDHCRWCDFSRSKGGPCQA